MSPDGETAFYLDGFFSKDELIEMAEHVFPYDSERIKHYAPTWLPEGFEVSEPIQLDTMYGLTYTNSDGQKITFTCIYGGDATDVIIASEDMTASAVTVGTVQADFYEEPQAGNANMLVWQPETDECLFCIAASLPEETLVRIAESVVEEQEG